ncbi:MAG TPA: polymer-forming cytoskeletal protein [Aggregicoccus sp.]|nr:polymer-forming cytoskeletal protein [Aggregicoccus sp.]
MATKDLASSASNNTVVGPSILISGKLTGDEDLTVRGRVEGEITLSHTLLVEPSGVVKANVAVKNAIVSGVVVGNINATESVELTREGRMVGDIHAPRVIIVDGASFRGRVDMGEVEPGRVPVARPVVARPTVRTAPAAVARPTTPPAPPRPPPAGAAAPALRPGAGAAAGARPGTKPLPPPPPAKPAETRASPVPPVVASGAKKKVVLKKKAR